MDTKKDIPQHIICPVCHGTGKNKVGFSCQNCGGLGVGTFFYNHFLYWGLRLGRTIIELNHLRKKFHRGLKIISWGIFIAGLASLGYWFFITFTDPYNPIPEDLLLILEKFSFWKEKSVFLLIFWVSVYAFMFIIYQSHEENRLRKKIKQIKYTEKTRRAKLPNNWEELKRAKESLKIDVVSGFSDETFSAIEKAFSLTAKLNHNFITPLHLFYSVMEDKQVAAIFSRLNVKSGDLLEMIKKQLIKIENNGKGGGLSHEAKEALVDAYIQAYFLKQEKVTPKNLLIPCLDRQEIIEEILQELGVDRNKIFNVLLWLIVNEHLVESYQAYKKAAGFKPSKNMDRAYTAVATPTLNAFAYDLTVAAKWGKLDYCVAREKEIGQIFQNLESGFNGVVLAGPPGVGKETIIDGIAQLMVVEDVPRFLQDKRLVELDAARLISGVSPANAQGRMIAIVDEIARAGNIILYIKNIERISGITSGEEESMDLSDVLASAIERRLLFCLASTTAQNYTKYLENESLGSVMAKVNIKEPEGDQAIQIIESKISYYEGVYKVYFSYNAIEEVIRLSKKYIHDKYLPQKAINILEMVAVRAAKTRGQNAIVSQDNIAAAVSEITGIPVTKVTASEGKELLNLEERIHERMIGQEKAVDMISSSLRRARTQIREGKRPIANFLFLGPTGVGKTELAKTVSQVYFGDEKYMIRVDMSEYQHEDSIKKMIGDTEGTKGYLTEAVRKSPFTLVLLDEIEKAHPDILNVFLQVMDDGRLTDGEGRTIDFTNTIIIATSNAGALYIQEEVRKGTNIEEIKNVLLNEKLNKVMRPELVNRFDGVIVFEPLKMADVIEITKLMLKRIAKMLEGKGIEFEADKGGIRILAGLGFDPKFGARPLRRLLQDRIEDEIANKILAGELERRDTVVINANAEVKVRKAEEL